MSGTEVTCRDLETGESETATITDNHIVIVDGRAHVSSVVAYANGTHIYTIKRAATVEEAHRVRPTITRHFGKAALS